MIRFTYIKSCLNKTVGKKSRRKEKWKNKKNILLEASKRSSSVLLWFLYSILISVHFFIIISKSTFVIVSHERYVDLSLYISVFEKHSQIFESEFWLKMEFKLLIETHRRSEGYENKFDTIFSNRDNSSWSIIESIKLIRAGPIANKLSAYETTFSVKAF